MNPSSLCHLYPEISVPMNFPHFAAPWHASLIMPNSARNRLASRSRAARAPTLPVKNYLPVNCCLQPSALLMYAQEMDFRYLARKTVEANNNEGTMDTLAMRMSACKIGLPGSIYQTAFVYHFLCLAESSQLDSSITFLI